MKTLFFIKHVKNILLKQIDKNLHQFYVAYNYLYIAKSQIKVVCDGKFTHTSSLGYLIIRRNIIFKSLGDTCTFKNLILILRRQRLSNYITSQQFRTNITKKKHFYTINNVNNYLPKSLTIVRKSPSAVKLPSALYNADPSKRISISSLHLN